MDSEFEKPAEPVSLGNETKSSSAANVGTYARRSLLKRATVAAALSKLAVPATVAVATSGAVFATTPHTAAAHSSTSPKSFKPEIEQRKDGTMATVLAFRTRVGGVTIPVGHSEQLGTVDVSPYRQIRLVADERIGSGANVTLQLTITEGDELVALLDQPVLSPHSQLTKVYDVPGKRLTISADVAGSGPGNASVDVLIYGN